MTARPEPAKRVAVEKRYLVLLIPVALALALFLPKLVFTPEQRTRGLFAIVRAWERRWPFEHGKHLPIYLAPAAAPLVPVWQQLEPQVRMLLDPNDQVAYFLLAEGRWEAASWQVIEERLSPGATFVDVGAQIGYYSLKAAQRIGPEGRVFAVEPNPETVPKLEANIRASGAKSVTVEPVACSDAEAMLDLYASASTNTGESSLSKANASQKDSHVRSYRVRARPLDDIMLEAGVSRVDVIKIDVEGAEYQVLKGARTTLARFHPMVLVELGEGQLANMHTSTAQILAFFREQGYVRRRLVEDNVEFVFGGSAPAR